MRPLRQERRPSSAIHRTLPPGVRRYWAGRHLVITGGSSGIGLAVAELALDAGAAVSVLALQEPALDRLHERTGPLAAFPCDVTRPDEVERALSAARARHGAIGALVTCAGVSTAGYFAELDDAAFRLQMEVNYFGTLIPVRQALGDLIGAERGSFTAVSSVAGAFGVFGYGAYSPSKCAVRGLGDVLRQELKPSGVSVTVVYPPDVDTPMLAAEAAQKPPELCALSGDRPLRPEAVARAVLVGTARRRASVFPGWSTRLICWLNGTAPGLVARVMDAVIARERRRHGA